MSKHNPAFDASHDAWLADCLAEYNHRFSEDRQYCQAPELEPAGYDPEQLVEFSENGDAYPHSAFGTGHIRAAVTSWNDSPHWVPNRIV